MSDELNPNYTFSMTHTVLLLKLASGEVNVKQLIRKELANRGVDKDGVLRSAKIITIFYLHILSPLLKSIINHIRNRRSIKNKVPVFITAHSNRVGGSKCSNNSLTKEVFQ